MNLDIVSIVMDKQRVIECLIRELYKLSCDKDSFEKSLLDATLPIDEVSEIVNKYYKEDINK